MEAVQPVQTARPWLGGVCAGASAGLGFDVLFLRATFILPGLLVVLLPFSIAGYALGRAAGLRAIQPDESLDTYRHAQALAGVKWLGYLTLLSAVVGIPFVVLTFLWAGDGPVGLIITVMSADGALLCLYRYFGLRSRSQHWTRLPPGIPESVQKFQRMVVIGWVIAFAVVILAALVAGAATGSQNADSDDDDGWDADDDTNSQEWEQTL